MANLTPTTPEGKPQWNKLLDPSSLLRLFYSLRLVSSMVTVKRSDSEAKKQDMAKWSVAARAWSPVRCSPPVCSRALAR
jgi:hypothetical protein